MGNIPAAQSQGALAGMPCHRSKVQYLSMNRRLLRRVACSLIGLFAFAQGVVALAACSMERGMQIEAAQMEGGCDDNTPAEPMRDNACAAHCTADLQVAGAAVALVQAPADSPALIVSRPHSSLTARPTLDASPPRLVPPRILLHSFLV